MQDQLVFVFDVEQLVPLDGGGEDAVREERLDVVKRACLRIAISCSNTLQVEQRKRILPSIGFRFYSSTDFFSIPPSTIGKWHDLSLKNWELLETALTERIDQAAASAGAALPGDGEDHGEEEDGGPSAPKFVVRKGPRSAGDGMARVLEEVATLFAWDRPQLYSPVKGEAGKAKMGNSVFLLTSLPSDLAEINTFLGLPTSKRPTTRDMEVVMGKKMRELCNGELGLKIHLLDTGTLQSSSGINPEVLNLFAKVLKQPKGGVLPLPSLTTPGLPTSALLSAHLKDLSYPQRAIESNYCLSSLSPLHSVETRNSTLNLSGFQMKCAVPSSIFPCSQKWTSSSTLWSPLGQEDQLVPIISFLEHSSLVIVYQESETSTLGILSPHSSAAVTFATLSTLDSHFYSLILRLSSHKKPENIIPPSLLSSLPLLLDLSPSPVPMAIKPPESSTSSSSWLLERWLLPSTAPPSFLPSMVKRQTVSQDLHSDLHRKMLKVRETLLANNLPSVAHKKDMRSIVLEKKLSGEARTALNRKESEVSATSTGSRASSGGSYGSKKEAKVEGRKSLSRAARLRQLGEARGSLGGEVEEDKSCKSAALVKELQLQGKAAAAEETMAKLGDFVNSETLVEALANMHEEEVNKAEVEDNRLAGHAEATISLLLKHMDMTGVSKMGLEDLVTSRLLLDVPEVAKKHVNTARVAMHKLQVLLRAEVHWLLASKEKTEKYEESMLAHLRQVALHSSNPVMLEFVGVTITECYVDRQPELLMVLHDELDLERPSQLAMLLSPTTSQPPSAGPSSVRSRPSSKPPSVTVPAMAPPLARASTTQNLLSRAARSLTARPKSFDTSLNRGSQNRSINLAPTRREKRHGKQHTTTGRMITKKKVNSAKKPRAAASKSPKKASSSSNMKMVRRNLGFEELGPSLGKKSPRKAVKMKTPSKARRTPVKLTPGKQHRLLVPETPFRKNRQRKSDGVVSVAETPDKSIGASEIGSLRRKASFYQGTQGARASSKFEESLNASLILGNLELPDNDVAPRRMSGSSLFPHLVANKRKREREDADEEVDLPAKRRLRLNSFGDSSEGLLARDKLSAQTEEKPDLMHPTASVQPSPRRARGTPRKSSGGTPRKEVLATPGKENNFFSPTKRVQWDMGHQPPTPHRKTPLRPILKTPNKTPAKVQTPKSERGQREANTPSRVRRLELGGSTSPARCAAEKKTRLVTTPRKDLGSTPRKSTIRLGTNSVTDGGNFDDSMRPNLGTPSKDCWSPPRSPIIMSSRKKARLSTSPINTPQRRVVATPGILHGFNTPSPSQARKSKALSSLTTTANILDTSSKNDAASSASPTTHSSSLPATKPNQDLVNPLDIVPSQGNTSPIRVSLASPNKVEVTANEQLEFVSPVKSNQCKRLFVSLERLDNHEAKDVADSDVDQVLDAFVSKENVDNVESAQYDPELDLSQMVEEVATHREAGENAGTTSSIQANVSSSVVAGVSEFSMVEESLVSTPPDNPIVLAGQRGGVESRGPSEERLEQGRLYLPPSLKLELKSPKRFGCIYCSEKFSTRSLKDQHMQMELDKKIREVNEKKKQGALERERKRQESHERRNEKMRRTSPAELSGRIPRSLAMLQDKLSHNFVAEGKRARRLPEVFSPDFDSGKKKKTKKKMEDDEESESDKDGAESGEDEGNSDSDDSNATTDVILEELKPGELAQYHSAVPKTVSQLEDKLTGYFSPKGGKRTRKSPERLEVAAPVSSGSGSGRWSLDSRRRNGLEEACAVDTKRRPQIGAVETSTPVEGRSVRARPRVSYAEVPDTNAFDLSTGDEESPFERRRPQGMEESLESLKKRFETCNDESEEPDDRSAATRSQRRFVLGSSLRRRSSSRRRDIDISSASSSESPRVRVTTGKQDLSQEITDLSHSTAGDQEEVDEEYGSPPRSSHALPPKSPGKYQSSLTPGRGIKLVINRIKKPRQLELEMSSPMPLILPRLSRGVCKEMGISPNKLQSIMTQSPPPKPRPSQSTTPEKENRPRTPKLLLKRMPSSSLANSPLACKWKAETKLSPVKSVAARQTMESPGKVVYSPLSARSIHKLSTSPIISPHLSERRRHKKKVNKQLAYNNA